MDWLHNDVLSCSHTGLAAVRSCLKDLLFPLPRTLFLEIHMAVSLLHILQTFTQLSLLDEAFLPTFLKLAITITQDPLPLTSLLLLMAFTTS